MKHLITFENYQYNPEEEVNEIKSLKQALIAAGLSLALLFGNNSKAEILNEPVKLIQTVNAENTKDAEKAIKNLEGKGFEIDFAEKAKFLRSIERQSGSVELKFYEFAIGSKSVAGLTSTQFIRANKLNANQSVLMIHKNGGKAVLIYF